MSARLWSSWGLRSSGSCAFSLTGPLFVEARYHRNPDKIPQQIRYISHREERLRGGERRKLFGIDDRDKAVGGDEKAIERAFAEDGRGLVERPISASS